MLAAFLFSPAKVSGGTFSLVFILSSDGCRGFHCKDAALTTGISYTCGAKPRGRHGLKGLIYNFLPMCGPRDIEIMGYHEQIGLIRFDKGLCHFWLNLKSFFF